MRALWPGVDVRKLVQVAWAWTSVAAVLAATAFVGVTLWRIASDGRALSGTDEYVHADTAFKVHRGRYPYRGASLGQDVVDTWHCYTGHATIPWKAECGSPRSRPRHMPTPTGSFTTGYIHYPTYFVAGEGFRRAHDAVVGAAEHPIDTYRQFAATMVALGVLGSAAMAWLVGLRGASLLAATLTPVAASGILVYGTMVNPMSVATLCGALVAGTGLRWMLTGRGFWWLAAATGFAAVVAVTASLPGAVLLLATLLGLVMRRRGRVFDSGWDPRWWHALALATVLVAPVVLFGVFISARATVGNDAIYGAYQFEEWSAVWLGVWAEVFVPHLPWIEDGTLISPELGTFRTYVHAAGGGLLYLVPLVLVGALVAGATGAMRPLARDEEVVRGAVPRPRSAPALLALSTILGLLVYPPALRLLHALNTGIDYPIVSRYSISLAPLLVLVLLVLAKDHPWFARVLVVVAGGGVLARCLVAW